MSLRLDWLWDCETLTEFIGSSCGELVRLLSLPLRFALLHDDDWFACKTDDDDVPCVLEHPAVLLMRSLQSAFLLAAPPTSPKNLNETTPMYRLIQYTWQYFTFTEFVFIRLSYSIGLFYKKNIPLENNKTLYEIDANFLRKYVCIDYQRINTS
jgi:hypothetical protein